MTKKDENILLARGARSGDRAARDKLIVNNMPLVYVVAARHASALQDAVSVGCIGLIKAADSFDPERNLAFSTFAAKCIYNEIIMEARRLGKHRRELSLSAEGENGVKYEDTLASPLSADAALETAEAREVLASALNSLPDRERGMLALYAKGVAQAQIGRAFGVSQSYVSRLNGQSVKRLRRLLENQAWIVNALRA